MKLILTIESISLSHNLSLQYLHQMRILDGRQLEHASSGFYSRRFLIKMNHPCLGNLRFRDWLVLNSIRWYGLGVDNNNHPHRIKWNHHVLGILSAKKETYPNNSWRRFRFSSDWMFKTCQLYQWRHKKYSLIALKWNDGDRQDRIFWSQKDSCG